MAMPHRPRISGAWRRAWRKLVQHGWLGRGEEDQTQAASDCWRSLLMGEAPRTVLRIAHRTSFVAGSNPQFAPSVSTVPAGGPPAESFDKPPPRQLATSRRVPALHRLRSPRSIVPFSHAHRVFYMQRRQTNNSQFLPPISPFISSHAKPHRTGAHFASTDRCGVTPPLTALRYTAPRYTKRDKSV